MWVASALWLLGGVGMAQPEPSPLVPAAEVEAYTRHPADLEGVHYKPGKGLVVASEDGLFSMAVGLRVGFRYEVENDPGVAPGEDPLVQRVMLRRARVTFQGHMWGEDSKYKVELAVSPRDESVDDTGYLRQTPLLTWVHRFTRFRDLSLEVGQYKVPFSRERLFSSSKLAMVDRSRADKAFQLDRDIGMELYSDDLGGMDLLEYHLGVYAGEGRGRFESTDFGLLYVARAVLTPGGGFSDMEPQDFLRTGPRLSVGLGYAYADRPHGMRSILDGGPADGEYAYHTATVDALFKVRGVSVEGAWFWRDGGEALSRFAETGTGFYVQPGALIPHQPVGLALRYAQVIPEAGGALAPVSEVGPALSWYMHGSRNKLKLQADYLRTWTDDPAAGEDLARLQFQTML